MPKKSSPKASSVKSAAKKNKNVEVSAKKSVKRRLFSTMLKLSIIFIVALGLYGIYLDGKVRNRFEGERWQVPIQVFSQVQKFKVGQPISLKQLSSSLLSSGYQRANKAQKPGQFALSSKRIIVYRRDFDLGNKTLSSAKVIIDVNNNRVSKLYLNNKAQKSVSLEPILIDRIVPDNKEDRVLVQLEQVPEQLIDTLLLVEDRDFYFHKGVSPLGILRALYSNIVAGRTVQGGSTLTQQLVKNMFLTREKTYIRKFNEALMSLILELRYSKDQLLEAYINEVYLGQHYANGIYGFSLAANFYFGVEIDQLSPAQMATLVGVIKGPSYYDPWRYSDRTQKRRDLVLRLMFEHHLINRNEFQQAIESQVRVRKQRRLTQQKFPNYLQLVKSELANNLPDFHEHSGIKVFTAFSPSKQFALQQSVDKKLAEIEQKYGHKDLQVAMIVTDIESGEVNALIGDRNPNVAGFNRAINGQRHIGSLIKPAVYLPALEQYEDYNLATLIEDAPIALQSGAGDEWRPKNYNGKYRGKVPLIDGLVESLNVPTVNIGMSLGLANVEQALDMLGYHKPITLRPSMLLGAINMSPMQVNQLYLPLANGGAYQPVHAITHVMSNQGETLWQYQLQPEQRLSEQAVYLMDYALNQVTTRGTAKSLTWRLKNTVLAGKTGTSNDMRDSWFIGFDARQLVTTWVGFDDNKATKLTGSSGALPLFADYMARTGVINRPLIMPESVSMTNFEANTGNAVDETCLQMHSLPAIQTSLQYYQCMEKAEDKRSWFEKVFGD